MKFTPRPLLNKGFSLIELMVAVTLSLILLAGLLGVISTVSRNQRGVQGLSRLQENARFALQMISKDIAQAGSQFCLNYTARGNAPDSASEPVRGIWVDFDATGTPWWLGSGTPTEPYWFDPAGFVRGFECGAPVSASGCTPNPNTYTGLMDSPLPAIGTDTGDRTAGTDIIHVRYLSSPGTPVSGILNPGPTDGTAAIALTLPAGITNASELFPSGVALVADCALTAVARVTPAANQLTLNNNNFDDEPFPIFDLAQARAFDYGTDLADITYYLQITDLPATDSYGSAGKTTTLMRRDASGPVALVDGIERLDFLYHVETANGSRVILSADQMEAFANCREWESSGGTGATAAGCAWRSLAGVEIHLLATSVTNVDAGVDTPFRYSWLNDGTRNTNGVFESPDEIKANNSGVMRNGLPPGYVARREFSTFVALRGFNP